MRKNILCLLIVCWFAFFLASCASGASSQQSTPTATLAPAVVVTAAPAVQATPALEQVKLELEIEKLRHENDWRWINLTTIIPSVLTMVGVVLAVIIGFIQWRRQHIADRAKADEERFQTVVKGFESERIEARVGAAILLLTFLQKEYEKFYSQVFHLAVSLLRARNVDPNIPEPMDAMSQALVIVLRRSFPLARGNDLSAFDPFALDATKAQLDNAYLSKTDFRKIYLREACLRKAYFWDAQLQEAYFKHSNMTGAYLRSANLEEADLGNTNLTGANLSKTNLRGAHFRKADLTNADFTDADLTNTKIENAKSLQGTILSGAKGLSPEQLAVCAAKGAII